MANIYQTTGVCASKIQYEVDEMGNLHKVKFMGGCAGNSRGLAAMIEGKNINEIIDTLSGIKCKAKESSCPDQLSIALKGYLEEHPELKSTKDDLYLPHICKTCKYENKTGDITMADDHCGGCCNSNDKWVRKE